MPFILVVRRSLIKLNQNDKQAVAWYRKAAEQGEVLAQTNLGVMYRDGRGVKKNKTTAKEWFKKSCNGGFEAACPYM